MKLFYIDRLKKEVQEEKVYGRFFLNFLYKERPSILAKWILPLICKSALFSRVYGFLQTLKSSRKKITPFIEKYQIETKEFEKRVEEFDSFNDFFTRKIKKRELSSSEIIIPADGRYLFFPKISLDKKFTIKGTHFDCKELIQDPQLSKKYDQGSMVIARLAPVDYHRYHFPCDSIPCEKRLINGYLYSVNPLALKKNINIFTENKRYLTKLKTKSFKEILFFSIGATNVGSIHETYQPKKFYLKGEEKGFFSFGGSALILLFEPNTITFESDLIELSKKGIEIKCLMGQSLGKSLL